MITSPDILSLLPIEILAGGMLLNMLLIAIRRSHTLTFIVTLCTIATAFTAILLNWPVTPHPIGDLFLIDRFGSYFQALILLTVFVVSFFSHISLRYFFVEKRKEEFYLLLLIATMGAAAMVISTHFTSFFVALEMLNISLYTLISYYRTRSLAIEAGLKYLILAAMSSAFLLFGMALIYTATGTLSFSGLATARSLPGGVYALEAIAGVGMMITGMGFKLALAPFHMWAPDVYEGASSPISAFIAAVSKGAMLVVLLRFAAMADLYSAQKIMLVFTVIALLSMAGGNLLALRQNNIKRMLAYSSIAHFGYLLVAFIAGKEMGQDAATFYITAYTIAVLTAFGLITLVSRPGHEATDIEDYRGLFWRKPVSAAILAVTLFSLAGIPLTAGFMGKFLLLTAGVEAGHWLLVFTLVGSSVIGLYYYLRFIFAMMQTGSGTISLNGTSQPVSPIANVLQSPLLFITGMLILAILAGITLLLGILPGWLIKLIQHLT